MQAERPISVESAVVRYASAVLATVLATLLRMALTPLVGTGLPFFTYLLAALAVVWYFGFGPAAVTSVLSAIAASHFFLTPAQASGLFGSRPERAAALGFVVITLAATYLIDLQQRTLQRARQEAERRKQAEDAERQQTQRFWTTLASIADAVVTTDVQGRIVFTNAVAESLLRCPASEMAGKPLDQVFRITDELTGARLEPPLLRILQDGAITGLAEHTMLIARDGTQIPIDDSAAPIRSEDGTIHGIVLVFRDISARRQAEQERRLTASIVDSSDDAIISKDLNGIITSWNRGAERMFGYSAAEIVGRPVSITYASDPEGEIVHVLGRIRRGERIDHFDTVRKTKSGELVNVSVTISPVYDAGGRIVGASTIARNITGRKRGEEELRATKEQLQVVTDNMAAAVTRCSRDFRYVWISRGYAGWIGRAPDEIAGRFIADVIGTEGFETIRPYMDDVLAGRKVEYTSQVNFLGPGKRWIHAVYVPTWARGEVDGWIAVVTDLTDMLQAHLQLRESNSKLARANEDLERFAFAASHDLQEPLRLISTLAQLLGRRLSGALDQDSAALLENIGDAASRMRELLSDLLAYSEVTERADSPETVDLNVVIDTVQKNLKTAIDENGALITAGHLPSISANPGHLVSLFQNLISNSIKYRSKEPPRIWISVQETDGHYRFAVADNGIGIEPEYHEKIFGVFARLHSKKIPGTGIGLAICQRVVERHGGRIWVESEPGHGSTFAFTFPKPSASERL